jgi:diguanylate cyclase (GGDEF)-like protein
MISKKDINVEGSELNEATTEIEKFAKKVFDKLIEENVYPIPYYYSIYFFNMLEDESAEFKKSVMELIELEGQNEFEEDLKFEQKLKKSFKYSKELVQHSAFIYKLSSALKEKNNVFLKEVDNISTPQVFKNLLLNSKKNMELINSKLALSLKNMKELYSNNLTTLKEIEKESIFDAFYGLYNKNYFLKETKREITQIEKFKHTSSLVVCRVSNVTMNKLTNDKSKVVVNRFIAKILLKTSRRTDIIAHIGDGVFGMLLKHTDRVGAMKTSERLSDTITNSAMFIEGEELEVNIVLGIAEILPEKDENDILECAQNMLKEAQNEDQLYKICEG